MQENLSELGTVRA